MEKLKLCGTGERRFGKALLVWQEDGSLRGGGKVLFPGK